MGCELLGANVANREDGGLLGLELGIELGTELGNSLGISVCSELGNLLAGELVAVWSKTVGVQLGDELG